MLLQKTMDRFETVPAAGKVLLPGGVLVRSAFSGVVEVGDSCAYGLIEIKQIGV